MYIRKAFYSALGIALLGGAAMAQEAAKPEAEEKEKPAWRPGIELSIDRTSKYMSEGNVGNPDPINTISLTAEFEIADALSLHVGGVAIIDETDACGNDDNVEEWDWLAGLTFSTPEIEKLGKIEFTLNYIYYNYPRDKTHKHFTDTKEYELDINAVDLFLSPGIAFVHDFENDVIKANANITFEYDLKDVMENLGFECPVELWFGNHQYTDSTSDTAAYSLCVQPTLAYEINENVTVKTYVQMGWALDGRVRADWKEDENNNAFNACWGLNLTLKF